MTKKTIILQAAAKELVERIKKVKTILKDGLQTDGAHHKDEAIREALEVLK